MSMIGCFWVLSDADLDAIVEKPTRLRQLWGQPPPAPPAPSFLSRLFGAKQPPTAPEPVWAPSEKPMTFEVDKAWHGIHFLLTGSDWEGSGPLAFILVGGQEIPEDMGYGPARGFKSTAVKEIAAALQGVDLVALYERADPHEFARNEIYPDIWEHEPKEECIRYVIDYLTELKKFISETAQANRALVVYLG